MQDVQFDRQGDVSFSEWRWFTPFPDSLNNSLNNSTDFQESSQVSGSDVITTLNLPLLGTLASIEKMVGNFKGLAELAVKEFFARRQDDMFEGLFMRRCARVLSS